MADERSNDQDEIVEQLRAAITLEAVREEGFSDFLRARAWAAAVWLLVIAALATPILFALVGFISGSFVIATVLAPLLGLAVAGGIGHWRGYLDPIDRARQDAPLWVRLLIPVPIFVLVFSLLFIGIGAFVGNFLVLLLSDLALTVLVTGGLVWLLGLWGDVPARAEGSSLWVRLLLPVPVFAVLGGLLFLLLSPVIEDFRLMLTVDVLASLILTGLLTWTSGLWSDVPARIRDSTPEQRLGALAGIGLFGGLIAFGLVLMLLEQVSFALAAFLPGLVLTVGLAAWLSGWSRDAHDALLAWHFGVRIGVFFAALALLTFYFALLVGPFLPNALLGYVVALVLSGALLIPVTIWIRAWRDLWATFVEMGGERRLVATLPVLPLGIGLVFGLIVVLTSHFPAAYVVSIPAGVGLFLLAGLPFGVSQDIPRVVRDQDMLPRTGIFLGFFLLTTLYAYFAIALFVQIVEVALIGGMVFAGAVLALLIWQFDLREGLAEEFESYGGPAEAAVLGGVFVLALALSFLVVGLATGDFRIAFLVSVLVAAGVNYLVAHSTGFVEGTRQALAVLPWWAELGVLSTIFVVAFLYGTIAVGSFLPAFVSVSFALGALLALGAVVALSVDLEIGGEIMEAADEKKRARTTMLVLAFLGGFMVGLYSAAAALGAVGIELFGFPFFVGLLTGVGAVLWLARRRAWDGDVLQRVRTGTDKLKVGVILVSWLGLGILTGFALQAIPLDGPVLGIGDAAGLPLTITLAAGLILWAWLPVALFRVVQVERTPVDATVSMPEKRKTLASLGWGVLAFAATLVLMLVLVENTVISAGVAVAVGYVTALVFSTRQGRDAPET